MGIVISDKITFILKSQCNNSIKLYPVNLRGGIDYVLLQLNIKKEQTTKKDSYLIELPINFNAETKTRYITNSGGQELITCATGYISNDKANWLRQLYSSRNVWFFDGENRIPTIIKDELVPFEDRGELINYKITFVLNDLIVN